MGKKKLRLQTQGSHVSFQLYDSYFLMIMFSVIHVFYNSLQVILDNGLLKVTISNPQGYVTGIKYAGMDNLLDVKSSESKRG